jgi:hypothetical protein
VSDEPHTVFAKKKHNSETTSSSNSKSSSKPSDSSSRSNDGSSKSSGTTPTTTPCSDGSEPVKGKCPTTTTPTTTTTDTTTTTPTTTPCSDGSEPVKGKCPTTTPSSSSTKKSQTNLSQSAVNLATNQIINSPGSTIMNQQTIKQSVKINNQVNNIIRRTVSASSTSTSSSTPPQAAEKPLTNVITVKLAKSSMSRNAYLPLADVSPYHLIGGHITANIPTNQLNIVVAQLASTTGVVQHAVIVDLGKTQISNTFQTDLGSEISGTNPFTGKHDDISNITNLFLWNNGNQPATFDDANGVTIDLIYK